MRKKELLAAGIVRDLRFMDLDVSELYFYDLVHRGVAYKILDSCVRSDGSVIIRILQQYNNSPLIEL